MTLAASRAIDIYRDHVQKGDGIPLDLLPAGASLHKQYACDLIKVTDPANRKVQFIISTGAVDRDNDTLKVDGWKLDAYRKNPVILFGHRYDEPPIGKAESILPSGGALKSVGQFVTPDEYPFGAMVYNLIVGGYLRAVSVGFRPIKSAWNNDRRGCDFEEQELLEYSVVPVPSNPEALLEAKSKGIDLEPLRGWAVRILDESSAEGSGLWIPKAVAERALKIAAGDPASTTVKETTVELEVSVVGVDEISDLAQKVATLKGVLVPEGGPISDAVAEPLAAVELALEKSVAVATTKAGRVLSKANEERLRKACAALDDGKKHLDECLAQLASEEDEEEQTPPEPKAPEAPETKAPEPKPEDAVLHFDDGQGEAETFRVDPELFRGVMREVLNEAKTSVTGRLD